MRHEASETVPTSRIEELLGDTNDQFELGGVGEYLRDRTALVTGAGGSIGSELCRQIAASKPRRLIALGRGEFSIFRIKQELATAFPGVDAVSILADVQDADKMDWVFRTLQPDFVFHSAAYKHVSFVEQFPEEGVRNNVFGSLNLTSTACRYRVEKFVLISTDKAANPTSVLGATKRLAERIIHTSSAESETRFIAVRFGNVVRSRGSVVPIFEAQIARGGPVTVTDPRMERYFMSLHEAVHLVLSSGDPECDEDLCVLDMGEPVRIVELVKALIRRQGRQAVGEIEIVFSGPRPGDRLSEQLFTEEEAQRMVRRGKMLVCSSADAGGNVDRERLGQLRRAVEDCRREDIVRMLQDLVPEYRPAAMFAG